jgi:DNA-binding transcriptional LysR family regulator
MSVSFDRLQLMATFIRIVESGSISAAARELRLAQSSVSRQLSQLETLLGASLLHRTTHSLSLTQAGREFLADSRRLVREWDGIEERFGEDLLRPRGRLKVVASIGMGQLVLVESGARYCRRFPEVELDWRVEDGAVSVLETGIDCLIKVGRITEESVVTQVVAYVPGIIVASPVLIAEHGRPQMPADLTRWPMIGIAPYSVGGAQVRRDKRKIAKVKGKPVFVTGNVVVGRGAALAGAGFAVLPRWLVESDLANGRLRQLLPGWEVERQPVSIGTPPAKQRPIKVALFIEEINRGLREFPGVTT